MTMMGDPTAFIEAWLAEDGPQTAPNLVLGSALETARRRRQRRPRLAALDRRAWPTRSTPFGSPADRRWVLLIAGIALLALVGIAAVGSRLLQPVAEPRTPAPSQKAIVPPGPKPSSNDNATPTRTPHGSDRPATCAAGLVAYGVEVPEHPAGLFVTSIASGGADARRVDDAIGGDVKVYGWSPDCASVLYSKGTIGVADDVLYRLDPVSGTPAHAIAADCLEVCLQSTAPTFSPDGRSIAFIREFGGAMGSLVAIIDLESDRVTELESTRMPNLGNVWWSPDGRHLAFSRYNNASRYPNASDSDVAAAFVVDADGSNMHKVTPKGTQALTVGWSLDGSELLLDVVGKPPKGGDPIGTDDVATIGPDGSGFRRLTDDGRSSPVGWTRDGRILFVVTHRGGIGDAGDYHLTEIDRDGVIVGVVTIPKGLPSWLGAAWQIPPEEAFPAQASP